MSDVHSEGRLLWPVLPMRPRQNHTMKPCLPLVVAATITMAGCGGDDQTTTTIPGAADPDAVAVIDDWAQTLNEGDVDGAAEFFAIPSVAVNGLALRINDIADARRFNSSLPCGASLEEAVPDGELIIATFVLTERPGPGTCGSGTGAEATTAFRIEDGKIVEWRRVASAGDDARPAPSSSA
jgi:hypothetical protein